MASFEIPRIAQLATGFVAAPTQFKAQVPQVKRQKDLRVLVLRYEHGSIQLGGFLFVQLKGQQQLEALVKIGTLRFEEDGIWVGVRPVFSRALEADWAKTAPKLKGATVLGLTASQHEFVSTELSQWVEQADKFEQATRDDEERARVENLAVARGTWNSLLSLAPTEAFISHFHYLLDSSAQRALLEKIATHVTDLRVPVDQLVFEFGDEDTLIGTVPTLKSYASWPRSFQKVVAVHEQLSFPNEGWALVLAESGAIDQRAPVTDHSDWWVYEGETLRLLSHEAGLGRRTELGAGALFLTRMLELLDDR